MTRRLALLILAAALPISAAQPLSAAPAAPAAKPDSALKAAVAATDPHPGQCRARSLSPSL